MADILDSMISRRRAVRRHLADLRREAPDCFEKGSEKAKEAGRKGGQAS